MNSVSEFFMLQNCSIAEVEFGSLIFTFPRPPYPMAGHNHQS